VFVVVIPVVAVPVNPVVMLVIFNIGASVSSQKITKPKTFT
jgi:hypothetical protein